MPHHGGLADSMQVHGRKRQIFALGNFPDGRRGWTAALSTNRGEDLFGLPHQTYPQLDQTEKDDTRETTHDAGMLHGASLDIGRHSKQSTPAVSRNHRLSSVAGFQSFNFALFFDLFWVACVLRPAICDIDVGTVWSMIASLWLTWCGLSGARLLEPAVRLVHGSCILSLRAG